MDAQRPLKRYFPPWIRTTLLPVCAGMPCSRRRACVMNQRLPKIATMPIIIKSGNALQDGAMPPVSKAVSSSSASR